MFSLPSEWRGFTYDSSQAYIITVIYGGGGGGSPNSDNINMRSVNNQRNRVTNHRDWNLGLFLECLVKHLFTRIGKITIPRANSEQSLLKPREGSGPEVQSPVSHTGLT